MKIEFHDKETETGTIDDKQLSVAYLIAIKGNKPKLWENFLKIIKKVDDEKLILEGIRPFLIKDER